jgi:hypothetical protein
LGGAAASIHRHIHICIYIYTCIAVSTAYRTAFYPVITHTCMHACMHATTHSGLRRSGAGAMHYKRIHMESSGVDRFIVFIASYRIRVAVSTACHTKQMIHTHRTSSKQICRRWKSCCQLHRPQLVPVLICPRSFHKCSSRSSLQKSPTLAPATGSRSCSQKSARSRTKVNIGSDRNEMHRCSIH